MGKLYRFISFEAFVYMILKKSLTFVHPSVWADPYEMEALNRFALTSNNTYKSIDKLAKFILTFQFYCQSWTRLPESDALWRIYSHNDSAVRIEIDESNIESLNDIVLKDVKYVDSLDSINFNSIDIYEAASIKRDAFVHENEVRLINHYKYKNEADFKNKAKSFMALYSKDSKFRESIDLENIESFVDFAVEDMNLNLKNKTKDFSYGHINNFIESVMLTPFAPDWVDSTVKFFCRRYKINYIGKSSLYTESNWEPSS